jgi:Carboxypeptidase regulatory-like domain/TonB-dependent Receptor Plug Domain
MRKLVRLFLALCVCFVGIYAHAQSGTVTGQVYDSQGAKIPNADVRITSEVQGTTRTVHTNESGRYTAPFLEPGPYHVSVQAKGFATAASDRLTLSVNQTLVFDVKLKLGTEQQQVTVEGGSQAINTTDATVGTVIDRQFVENIPLNGRSFQSLIQLSPGVVTTTPQGQGNTTGEFSVNGQRTDANNYTVDGVSANNGGLNVTSAAGSAGMASSSTGLGTTQAILSVDALQEFSISTSSYSAEYGRQPGAQISMQSRSGTNQYHGTAFEYLRNYAFDANDWFDDYSVPAITKPQERQNDFGGVVGGPISIPHLFSGKDRAFFFFSYEGLRLVQPQPASIYYVPSNGTYNTGVYSDPQYENLRANAPAALQPVLNAMPLPNCSVAQDAQCVDYGDGLSPYIASSSSPSSIDAIMGRLDYQVSPGERLFVRYSDTESRIASEPYGTDTANTSYRTRFYLLGLDSVLTPSLTNELRTQYSPAYFLESEVPGPFGGAQPQNLAVLQGLPPVGGESTVQFEFPAGENAARLYQINYGARQFQPNVVDTLSWAHGPHLFKAGVDYRQTTAYLGDGYLSRSPDGWYYYDTPGGVLQNIGTSIQAINFLRQDPTSKNLSLFVQDNSRVNHRVNLSVGMRWEFDPAPSISGAQQYTYTGSVSNPSSMALSAQGAPLYKSTYTNFAPRVGVAVTLLNQPGHELVLRGGGGMFYDTGQAFFLTIGDGEDLGVSNYQNLGSAFNNTQGFPVPANVILAPIPTVAPPYSLGYVPDPHLVQPSSIQWNVSLEQALGQGQSINVGYVGTEGRNLITETEYDITSLNPLFLPFVQYENGPGSNYNALQIQFKRQAIHGLQALASYTWSHALDSASADTDVLPIQRGNGATDVRNIFTAALVYSVPTQYANRLERQVLGHWDADLRFVARTAFPVEPTGPTIIDPVSGDEYPSRLNYNGGNPYVRVAGIPGGRQFNPAVFSVATASQDGDGNSPRDFLRGFGETQTDISIQRTFPIVKELHLLFRAEAFNVFNHPNFGTLNVSCGASDPGAVCNNSIMGQATDTLANSTLGGLASIYQQGGPRSMQFALKLQF